MYRLFIAGFNNKIGQMRVGSATKNIAKILTAIKCVTLPIVTNII